MTIQDWILPWRARKTIQIQTESLARAGREVERANAAMLEANRAATRAETELRKAQTEHVEKLNEIRKWMIVTYGLGKTAPSIKLFGQR